MRQKLRALSALATSIRFPFVQEEEVTLEDGICEVKRFGKTYTETRMTKVKFKCYYTWGVIRVETEWDGHGKTPRIMAEEFSISMTYRDGQGMPWRQTLASSTVSNIERPRKAQNISDSPQTWRKVRNYTEFSRRLSPTGRLASTSFGLRISSIGGDWRRSIGEETRH